MCVYKGLQQCFSTITALLVFGFVQIWCKKVVPLIFGVFGKSFGRGRVSALGASSVTGTLFGSNL